MENWPGSVLCRIKKTEGNTEQERARENRAAGWKRNNHTAFTGAENETENYERQK
jgi:hypothetical protein